MRPAPRSSPRLVTGALGHTIPATGDRCGYWCFWAGRRVTASVSRASRSVARSYAAACITMYAAAVGSRAVVIRTASDRSAWRRRLGSRDRPACRLSAGALRRTLESSTHSAASMTGAVPTVSASARSRDPLCDSDNHDRPASRRWAARRRRTRARNRCSASRTRGASVATWPRLVQPTEHAEQFVEIRPEPCERVDQRQRLALVVGAELGPRSQLSIDVIELAGLIGCHIVS